MDVTECIDHITSQGKLNRSKVSASLGKSRNYISAIVNQGNDPSCSTMAEIADACGYELLLRGHGEEIPIDPKR